MIIINLGETPQIEIEIEIEKEKEIEIEILVKKFIRNQKPYISELESLQITYYLLK
jgi:hypothetical protein